AAALERQPHARRTADRHRDRQEDRDLRRHAAVAADGRARHAPRRGDADPRALRPRRWPGHALVVIDGSGGASLQLATCCRPIPGAVLVGSLGRGEALLVHTAECPVARKQADKDPERWMGVEWAEEPTRTFETAVTVLVRNGKGVLAQVASA